MTLTDPRARGLSEPRVDESHVDVSRVDESCVLDPTAVEVADLCAQVPVALAGVRAAVAHLRAVVDGEGFGWADDAQIAEGLLCLVEVRRQVEAITGDFAARVSHGSAFAQAGFRTAASWLRARTNESLAAAKRTLEAGDWLGVVPVMGQAWREGRVSRAHVAALVEAHARFPRCSPGLTLIEEQLTQIATELDPRTFARMLMAKLHQIDPGAVDDADARRRRRDVGLHVSTLLDGYVRVDGLLTPEIGQQLINSLASARDALRAQQTTNAAASTDSSTATDITDTPLPQPDPRGVIEPRLSQRNLEALAFILTAAETATGQGRLPDISGARPVVHITIDSQSLIDHGASAPGWITTLTGTRVTPITAQSAQRLACDAVRQILILDPRGHLDAISRTDRIIPTGLRKAIHTRDHGTCRFPGCTTTIREIHHIIYWQHGGTTTTDNLVGLCSHHHHLIHDRRWKLTGNPNHTITFTDPHRHEWHSDPPPRE